MCLRHHLEFSLFYCFVVLVVDVLIVAASSPKCCAYCFEFPVIFVFVCVCQIRNNKIEIELI